MEKRRNGGFTLLLCLLFRVGFVVVSPSLLLLPRAAAAADSSWHPSPPPARRGHHVGGGGGTTSNASPPAVYHDVPPRSAPAPAPSPAPTAGADDMPAGRAPKQAPPHFGFPLQPTFGLASPPAGPSAGGEGYPFIGSNPTVPLPTGMTDSSTVLPLPDRGDAGNDKLVGRAAAVRVQIAMIGVVATISILFLSGS